MERHTPKIGELFLGAVTLGERGQIVIPAEAREEYDLKPGDKLLVFHHPKHCGIMISRVEDMQRIAEEIGEFAKQISTLADESTEENSDAS